MSLRNTYISASAGAGKTYQLVNRYITLLALQQIEQGEIDVSQIIAITFTRKAAGEFKSRILAVLAKAAQSESDALDCWEKRVGEILGEMEIRVDVSLSAQEFFKKVLAQVMEQFSQLNLSTIDSLFQRIAHTLCSELGIAQLIPLDPRTEEAKWRYALDLTYEQILLQAPSPSNNLLIETMIDSLDQESSLAKADSHIFEIINKYHETLKKSPNALWGGEPSDLSSERLERFGLMPEDVELSHAQELAWGEQLSELQKLLEKDSQQGMTLFPDPIKVKGETNIYKVLCRSELIAMTGASLKAYRSKFITYIKSLAQINKKPAYMSPGKGMPTDEMLQEQTRDRYAPYWAICRELGFDLDEIWNTRSRITWRALLKRTHALQQLLCQVDENYQNLVRNQGFYSFADVARLLQEAFKADKFSLVQERLDLKLQHWLLDEFQDTSKAQYSILKDLLLARAQGGDEEGSVFMVGDAKQSIYGFCGGDPEIFLNAKAELFGLPNAQQTRSQDKPLNTSYRSSQTILNFANEVFGEKFESYAPLASASAHALWKNLQFNEHKAAEGNENLSGCVEIWHLNNANAAESVDGKLHRTIAQLLAHIRPQGAENKPRSCAVLTTANDAGLKIYNELKLLQAEYGFEGPLVYSGDRDIASDAPLGHALMQLFKWLQYSGDKQSFDMLRLTPLWQAVEKLGGEHCWQYLRQLISMNGFGELLRQLSSGETKRIIQQHYLLPSWKVWVDEAHTFDEGGGTLQEWIDHIQKVLMRDEAQGNCIQIMTIHKSKGLEFDSVILPFIATSDSISDYSRQIILHSKDGQSLMIPPKDISWAKGHKKFYSLMVEPWKAQEEFGAFCRLYVALTRAKRANYIITPKPPKSSKSLNESFRHIFEQIVDNSAQGIAQSTIDPEKLEEATCVYHIGNPLWYKEKPSSVGEISDKSHCVEAPTIPLFSFEQISRLSPSRLDESSSMTSMDSHGAHAGIEFGNRVHHLMQYIDWVEPSQSYKHFMNTLPKHMQAEDEKLLKMIYHAVQSEAWQKHFVRPSQKYQLYREQNIEALWQGDWVSGQIDRLVVIYEESSNSPVSAHIYDYKTNATDAPQKLITHYREQMRAYRQMCALALGLSESRVDVSILHCPQRGSVSVRCYEESDWLRS